MALASTMRNWEAVAVVRVVVAGVLEAKSAVLAAGDAEAMT